MKIVIEGTEQEIAEVLKKLAGEKVEYIPIYPLYPVNPQYPPYQPTWRWIPNEMPYTTCSTLIQ